MSGENVGFGKRNGPTASLNQRLDVKSLPHIDPEKLRARLYAKPEVHVNPQQGMRFTGRTAAQLKKVEISIYSERFDLTNVLCSGASSNKCPIGASSEYSSYYYYITINIYNVIACSLNVLRCIKLYCSCV